MAWVIKAHADAREAERREQRWHTWHAAALQRVKMPSLSKFMGSGEDKKPVRRQNAQEIFAIMEMWRRKIDRQNARVKR